MKKLFVLVLTIGIIGSGYLYIDKIKENTEVISFSDEIYLIVEDIVVEEGEPLIIQDGILYFSYDFIKEYIDENIFYDVAENLIIFTYEGKVKRYTINENIGSVNSKEFTIDNVIKKIENKVYIPKDLFIEDYEVDINYYPLTNAVVMDFKDIYYLQGEIILDNGIIRSNMDIKAPILIENLELGSILYVYGEYEDWYKVRTMDGIPGFINRKYLRLNHTKDIYKTELQDRKDNIKTNSLNIINLTWDYTYGKVTKVDGIKPIPGLNIISPTWFSVTDEEGNILDRGNKEYVKKYNDLGYEVWPLIDNSFDPSMTHEILKSSLKREEIINSILSLYLDYGFQGINIDFENVYLKDRELLTQFVRELYPLFKQHDLVVSMDVTAISTSENWSMSFDRKKLQETTDYLILMAYDQHPASSKVAGSVAQYSWVEKSLTRIFEEIPKEMLILAVPYYTRLWIVEEDNISSQAIGMETANKFIRDNKIQLEWDHVSRQFYGEMEKNNKEYQIWLEDAKSLKEKISLINKYGLAGVASWRKGFETEDIWETIAVELMEPIIDDKAY